MLKDGEPLLSILAFYSFGLGMYTESHSIGKQLIRSEALFYLFLERVWGRETWRSAKCSLGSH